MDTSAIVQGVQFQVVQHMNKTELEEFLEKDDRVQSMVDDHSVVREIFNFVLVSWSFFSHECCCCVDVLCMLFL